MMNLMIIIITEIKHLAPNLAHYKYPMLDMWQLFLLLMQQQMCLKPYLQSSLFHQSSQLGKVYMVSVRDFVFTLPTIILVYKIQKQDIKKMTNQNKIE